MALNTGTYAELEAVYDRESSTETTRPVTAVVFSNSDFLDNNWRYLKKAISVRVEGSLNGGQGVPVLKLRKTFRTTGNASKPLGP